MKNGGSPNTRPLIGRWPNDRDDQAAANHSTITRRPIRRSGPSVGYAGEANCSATEAGNATGRKWSAG
jgi:hypothetical protein